MTSSFQQLIDDSKALGIRLWQVIVRNELQDFGGTEESLRSRMAARYKIMRSSVEKARHTPLKTAGNLINGYAKNASDYAAGGNTICGGFINDVMAAALSASEVNASMGQICACPTAGSCGIVPAVLVTMAEERSIPEDTVIEALILASGFGSIVTENATVSGAEGGCQAECGVAAAMASAAAVYLAGGSDEASINAFSISLMNVMGLVCDPVAGLVQIPCAQRNASQAVNALLSADLALGGMVCPISPDEITAAMYSVGRSLPRELRETALGGIAATDSAREIERSIFGS